MNKRGGLGRGLAALIPTGPAPTPLEQAPALATAPDPDTAATTPAPLSPAPTVTLVPAPAPSPVADARAEARAEDEGAIGVPGARLVEVAVGDIVPNPKQPRLAFDDEALDELTHSVKEFGL